MLKTLFILSAIVRSGVTTVDDVQSHIKFLASPELEGRMTLSPGMEKAASYIAYQFRSAGLKEGPNKGFIWKYETTVNFRTGKGNWLGIMGPETVIEPQLGRGFEPLVGSADGKAVQAPVVWANAGTEADYQSLNVKGAIVMVMESDAIRNEARAKLAADNGAVGIIVVYPDRPNEPLLPRLNRGTGISPDLHIVAVAMRQAAVKDFERFSRPENAGKFRARIRTEVAQNKGVAKDVIGYLPGNDPKLSKEYVIVGAHFDHLGYGETGSRTGHEMVHPGADDNASGTAGVIELAKYFARKHANKRTMIFQTYSGEEEGLLGSDAWAKAHASDLAKTTAMINMDMIGRLRDNKLDAFGFSSCGVWSDILGSADKSGLDLVTMPNVRADSDQASFARRNVPVIEFFTGLHMEYHTENDTYDSVNFSGMVNALNLIADVINRVDAAPKMTFDKNAVMGNLANDRTIPGAPKTGARRIRVGFIPDMTATGPGAAITGTSPGSPAEKAGLKAGDRITEFNGHKVEDLETLSQAMATCKPGDKVKIKFLREGKAMEVELVVEERQGDPPPARSN